MTKSGSWNDKLESGSPAWPEFVQRLDSLIPEMPQTAWQEQRENETVCIVQYLFEVEHLRKVPPGSKVRGYQCTCIKKKFCQFLLNRVDPIPVRWQKEPDQGRASPWYDRRYMDTSPDPELFVTFHRVCEAIVFVEGGAQFRFQHPGFSRQPPRNVKFCSEKQYVPWYAHKR